MADYRSSESYRGLSDITQAIFFSDGSIKSTASLDLIFSIARSWLSSVHIYKTFNIGPIVLDPSGW